METKNGVKTFHAKDRKAWRLWLQKNEAIENSVWLIIYKKSAQTKSVSYIEAVEEALCFGWIDSKPNKRDEHSFYQFFARRKPTSNWSKINKDRVEMLLQKGLMAAPGLASIKLAKESGTWQALDEVERLVVPDDLQLLFSKNSQAANYFEAFPKSIKRGILEWILNAKTDETRKKRVEETVRLAEKNIRANQYRPKST